VLVNSKKAYKNATAIIGIDCATQEAKRGLAYGLLKDHKLTITDVASCSPANPSQEIVSSWLNRGYFTLLALDAPLGWPVAMSEKLPSHKAGESLELEDNDRMFLRETDFVIWKECNKKPLEVGASLIARTATSALEILQNLRKRQNLAIPLAWEMGNIAETCAIEVYPAATLAARGIVFSGYRKGKAGETRRLQIIENLNRSYDLEIQNPQIAQAANSPDSLDAVVCVLAGADFLRAKCIPIPDKLRDIARKEGWIWVKK
jgi:Protein of unknown function (DUF429).